MALTGAQISTIYQALLARPASVAEQNVWLGIDAGQGDAAVIAGIVNLPEVQQFGWTLERMYQAAFGRVADQGGYAANVAILDPASTPPTPPGHLSELNLARGFVASQEFANRFTNGVLQNADVPPNAAFISALYLNVLQRQGSQAEINAWLALNQTAAQVLIGFADSVEFMTKTAPFVTQLLTIEANASIGIGTGLFTGNLFAVPLGPNEIVLQSSVILPNGDNVKGIDGANVVNNFIADLTPFLQNGIGPTLNPNDKIAGGVLGATNNLIIGDSAATGQDVIVGKITNIQNITLNTAGNAGAGSGAYFDSTGIAGVLTLTVNSGGSGYDYVKAAGTTDVTINHSNGQLGSGVVSFGGHNIVITNNGEYTQVGSDDLTGANPTGNVNVTMTNKFGSIGIFGGVDITVNARSGNNYTDGPYIQIGSADVNPGTSNPTGKVTVNNTGTGAYISIFGGTTVTVNAAGDDVYVGGVNTTLGQTFGPSGAVTIVNAAPTVYSNTGGLEADVSVLGGTTVSVTTNSGSVTVGGHTSQLGGPISPAVNSAGTAFIPGQAPTGNVTVVDTATNNHSYVGVFGGNNVTITASGLDVFVGSVAYSGISGQDHLVAAPTGNVKIVDNAAKTWTDTTGFGHLISVVGGQNVDITTNTAAVIVGSAISSGGGYVLFNAAGTGPVAGLLPTGTVTIVDTATAENSPNENYISGGGAYVNVFGGSAVTITASGIDVNVGQVVHIGDIDSFGTVATADFVVAPGPNADIKITNTAAKAFDFIGDAPFAHPDKGIFNAENEYINVVGGHNVDITTNAGGVKVGLQAGELVAGAQPTGTVSVTNNSTGYIGIYGGTNITVFSAGGRVRVGDNTVDTDPTGNVNVTMSAVNTGWQFNTYVDVKGGVNVTVNTTGGDVRVGDLPVTGAVVVNNTFSGLHHDSVDVVGGTTVNINTTPTDRHIFVGDAPILNLTDILEPGTKLDANNAKTGPTGAVVVNNSATFGAVTDYGWDHVHIYTNGSPSVSLTGGGETGSTTVIQDMQTLQATAGVNAGKAVGVSKLATVSLSGVAGEVDITSDALATLNLSNSGFNNGGGTATNATTVTLLESSAFAAPLNPTVTLSNNKTKVSGGNPFGAGTMLTAATAASMTINTSGSAANTIALVLPTATALTINNGAPIQLDYAASKLGALTTLTAKGSGTLTLGEMQTQFTGPSTIDATAATGAVLVQVNPGITSFLGGSGNDIVSITQNPFTFGAGVNIFGGGGTNTLYANYAAAGTDLPLGNNIHVSGFQNLGVVGLAAGTYDAAGFIGMVVGAFNPYTISYFGVSGPIVFTNVANGAGLTILASSTVTYSLDVAKAGGDDLPLTIGQNGALVPNTGGLFTGTQNITATLKVGDATTEIVNLSIATLGVVNKDINFLNDLTIEDDGDVGSGGIETITITGGQALKVHLKDITGAKFLNEETSDVNKIDASGSTATVDVTDVALDADDGGGVIGTILGGGGKLTANGALAGGAAGDETVPDATFSVDLIKTGAGGGTIGVGLGGSFHDFTPGVPDKASFGAGSETIDLSASNGKSDVVIAFQGTSTFGAPGQYGGSVSVFNGIGSGGVIGFNESASTNADVLRFGQVKGHGLTLGDTTANNVIANVLAPAVVGAGLSATIRHDVDLLDDGVANGSDIYLDNLQFTAVNGSINFSGVGIHTLSEFNQTQLLLAAAGILETVGPDTVAGFATASGPLVGNTYVVATQHAAYAKIDATDSGIASASFTEILGQGTFSGFGLTGANTAIVSVDKSGLPTAVNNNKGSAISTVGNTTIDDTGFSLDQDNGGGVGLTATFNNLAPSSQLVINSGVFDVGNIVTTQTGVSGTNSLTLSFAGAYQVDSLKVNGDGLLSLDNPFNSVIKSIVDGTNTIKTLLINNNGQGGYTEIDGITSTSLTTITASKDLGHLKLTANQDNLTITGALGNGIKGNPGGNEIFANGNNDTITIGAITGTIAQVASGGSEEPNNVQANGANAKVSVWVTDFDSPFQLDVGGNGAIISVATTDPYGSGFHSGDWFEIGGGTATAALSGVGGKNVTVNVGAELADGTALFGTDAKIWEGTNSSINIVGGVGDMIVKVKGDEAGATSSGVFTKTTINGAVDAQTGVDHFTSLDVNFNHRANESWAGGNALNSQVNVASATTLGQALDIAANNAAILAQYFNGGTGTTNTGSSPLKINADTGLVTWFQFQGNTYLLEANNNDLVNAQAHTSMGIHDILVQITGVVDPTQANFSATFGSI